MRGLIALTVGAALVAGCASGPRKPSSRALQQIDRALAKAPGKAQPSVIVKTELALSRSLREGNPRKAFQTFAAPTAQIHTEDGLVELATFLANGPKGSEGPQLETKSVYMSCDGSTAVSQGRLTENGKVGNYVIVWERQPGISTRGDEDETGYRYVYFTAAMDDPQPPPKPVITPGPNDIVVEALDLVRSDIAECNATISSDPSYFDFPESTSGQGKSRDGSLAWRWAQLKNDQRTFLVEMHRKGSRRVPMIDTYEYIPFYFWDTVLTLDLPSAP